jgi:2-octaprenylphenol hydroxylase
VNKDFDVVVIGAGMVGSALACLLAQESAELSLAVIDARESQPFDDTQDYRPRVSAISRASTRVLEACGVWQQILASRASPYRSMCVWDGSQSPDQAGAVRFESAEIGEPELGYIVENELIEHCLRERLRAASQVQLICPGEASGLVFAERGALVDLLDGVTLRSRLVVGADGSASPSRTMAGIETTGHEYGQSAVVCHVRTEKPHEETARQRFLPEGPLALLPLADGRCSIVWSTTPAQASRLTSLQEAAFLAELTRATDNVLGSVTETSRRFAFPLRIQNASQYVRERYALVGDAAHTVHPLAGQGVNLGFLDAAALAEVVLDALADDRDPGERRVLRRYERWRKGENLLAASSIDVIGQLFLRQEPAARAVRRAGMELVNRAPLVKNEIVRRAMGITGDLPRFARSPLENCAPAER